MSTLEVLGLALLELTGTNQPLSLLSVNVLDSSSVLASSSKTLSQTGKLLSINLAHDKLNVGQDGVDLSGGSLAISEVVDLLDGALNNTLVLLGSVLSGLLGLLVLLTFSLGGLLSILLALLLFQTSLLLLLSQTLSLGFLLETLLVLVGTSSLTELLNTLILSSTVVYELTETSSVLNLTLAASVGVLLLGLTLLVTAFAIIGHILVEVFKCTPAVEVIPEVVKVVNLLEGAVVITQLGNGLDLGETTLGLEDTVPQLVEVTFGSLLLGGRLNVSSFIDGVKLTTLDGVRENFVGLLDTLEETVVLVTVTQGGLLVGVVTENLLAVGTLDLLGGGAPTVFGNTKNGVVILAL